jgi:hypothetical protein
MIDVGNVGFRKLAAAVLLRAVMDAQGMVRWTTIRHGRTNLPTLTNDDQRIAKAARRWLLESPDVDVWAEAAGINAQRIRDAVRRGTVQAHEEVELRSYLTGGFGLNWTCPSSS